MAQQDQFNRGLMMPQFIHIGGPFLMLIHDFWVYHPRLIIQGPSQPLSGDIATILSYGYGRLAKILADFSNVSWTTSSPIPFSNDCDTYRASSSYACCYLLQTCDSTVAVSQFLGDSVLSGHPTARSPGVNLYEVLKQNSFRGVLEPQGLGCGHLQS